jgi:hypothetical protein
LSIDASVVPEPTVEVMDGALHIVDRVLALRE